MVMPESSRMEEKPHVDRSEEPATLESNQSNAHSESPRTSVLAILCVFCASLGFFLLPAIAAVPLGVGALRTIDSSKGRLRGRHLAVVGLCVSVGRPLMVGFLITQANSEDPYWDMELHEVFLVQ